MLSKQDREQYQAVFDKLTPRQAQIAMLLAKGKTITAAANLCDISPRTVHYWKTDTTFQDCINILTYLHIKNTYQLA